MNYLYDENNVRYSLISSNGGKALNWLFLPGGPGADSCYFTALTDLLKLEGNVWLIDFPGNGSHKTVMNKFDEWFPFLISTVKKFQNPVIVGHSFGGIMALLTPELEHLLSGLIITNSTPSLWMEAAASIAKELHLPDLTKDMQEFVAQPNQATFDKALAACMPYYFPPQTLEKGRALLAKVPFAYEAAVWGQHKVMEISYNATWIPQQVNTLIIGGEFDAIVPFSLFEKDERFNRPNITKKLIKDAGHTPWIEKPDEVKMLFENFQSSLLPFKVL